MNKLISLRLVVNGEAHDAVRRRVRQGVLAQERRLTIGCFPWKLGGGEAAFCRVVAFVED